MKKKLICLGLLTTLCLAFSACDKGANEDSSVVSSESISSEAAAGSEEGTASEAESADPYVGEYVDTDGTETTLEIAIGEDGKYVVQMGIYRLTSFEDGVGSLTDAGLQFTASDANGNPITAVITLSGDEATVTFTDSTWDLLPNDTAVTYKKTSDIPQLIQE